MMKNEVKNDKAAKKSSVKMGAFSRFFYDANFSLNSYVEALKAAETASKSQPPRRAFNRA